MDADWGTAKRMAHSAKRKIKTRERMAQGDEISDE